MTLRLDPHTNDTDIAYYTSHINTGHAFVLVFNISSKQSLTELKPIVELINEVRNIRNVADFQ